MFIRFLTYSRESVHVTFTRNNDVTPDLRKGNFSICSALNIISKASALVEECTRGLEEISDLIKYSPAPRRRCLLRSVYVAFTSLCFFKDARSKIIIVAAVVFCCERKINIS